MDWQARFDNEIQRAGQARQRGNEGRARVCARRAAGIIASEYLSRRDIALASASAMDVLVQLRAHPACPVEVIPLIDDFVQPVNVEFKLAPGVDLIAEAQRLRLALLPN